ncbi:MAG: citryl-CoA lyase [Candidatus Sungbacteria bacterium]|nr:citryl-CoA lyase [Candidatus Sungbacteria bacterium]
MKIKTEISASQDHEHNIRGKPLGDLIRNHSFVETLFLLFRGNMPNKAEEDLLNALLVSAAEHDIEAPSLFVPRISTSVGNPPQAALAAGILSIGPSHGGAGWEAARLLAGPETPQEIVTRFLKEHAPIPGYGHRIYKDADPRVSVIEEKIRVSGVSGTHFDRARAIEKELATQKGKHIPLNIDGAFAACVLDLGFAPETALELFILARIAGMSAHINEERQQHNPYYRLENGSL